MLNQENLSLREAEEREGRKPRGGDSVVQWESQTPPPPAATGVSAPPRSASGCRP